MQRYDSSRCRQHTNYFLLGFLFQDNGDQESHRKVIFRDSAAKN